MEYQPLNLALMAVGCKYGEHFRAVSLAWYTSGDGEHSVYTTAPPNHQALLSRPKVTLLAASVVVSIPITTAYRLIYERNSYLPFPMPAPSPSSVPTLTSSSYLSSITSYFTSSICHPSTPATPAFTPPPFSPP